MPRSILLAAALLLPLTLSAETREAVFIPCGAFYMHGQLVGFKPVGPAIATLDDCLEQLKKGIKDVELSGAMPDGGSIVGACVPVPKTVANPVST